MSTDIALNLAQIRQQINDFANACDRDPDGIQLLAVSKTKPVSDIRAAYAAGQTAFGENYLQEALDKIGQLTELPLEWHFIGALQSNKTRPIAQHFDWVHTLTSLKQAQRLNEQRPDSLPPLNVCVQLNISHEDSKSGIDEPQLLALANEVRRLPRLRLRGLMAIPAPSEDPDRQKQAFRRLRQLQEKLNSHGFALDTLSMGMSGDMQAAIEEGSTIVRIGTAIFGQRAPRT